MERPRRKVRFARLIDRAFWQAFGLRRLRRHLKPDLVTTHGDACTPPRHW
jgi:aminoglycoside phosphotransferase